MSKLFLKRFFKAPLSKRRCQFKSSNVFRKIKKTNIVLFMSSISIVFPLLVYSQSSLWYCFYYFLPHSYPFLNLSFCLFFSSSDLIFFLFFFSPATGDAVILIDMPITLLWPTRRLCQQLFLAHVASH